MINVNYGKSKQTLEACKLLEEYSWLIQKIREYSQSNKEIETSINQAISDMPDDYKLKSFLEVHKAEVNGMLTEEYNEEKTMERFKAEGGNLKVYELVSQGLLKPADAVKNLGITIKILKDNMRLSGYEYPT